MNEYRWLTAESQQFLERDYLLPNQTVDQRVEDIALKAETLLGIEGYAAKFKKYFQKGWFSLSTPVWTNFGAQRGLPISCFGSYIEDSMVSILSTHAEVGMMSKVGGGTSGYFGNLRKRGAPIRDNGESFGAVHFMQLFDSLINIVSQGKTRRGNFAAYLPIEHDDIHEFLEIRSEGNPLQDLFTGITVSDEWMQSMIDGDQAKRTTWAKVLSARTNTGFPYIMFSDTVNNNTVDVYKDLNMKIHHSNLCSEIMLPDNNDESFVCDLGSMNILYYEEWKDTDAVEVLTFLLDAVMTDFINKAKDIPFMEKSVRFAERHRALGIGWLGWHSYLQSKMIPFESMEAKLINVQVAKCINEQAWAASAKLATMFGEPEILKGYGRRNTTLTAIAPTKSSAFILGQVSEGVEPHRANYYIKDLQKGKFTIKNIHLEELLENKGKNTLEVWDSILKNSGSVQHLSFLSDQEKSVFKTFIEISPKEVIIQAGQRQKYVDQSQSLNLLIDPKVPAKDVNALLIDAWHLGVKSLYYQISVNAAQQLTRSILSCENCSA
jgi:ribonucleoside-diphosphate reductase alpha chain